MISQGWKRRGVDLDRWIVTGHSNGGQGVWYALTHRSDKIIAATPFSGYLSIPGMLPSSSSRSGGRSPTVELAYVPYNMWHEASPKKMGLVMASLDSYKHELLVENLVGTPILQGHGELDDNVPTFHSRRMSLLVSNAGWQTKYHEFQGKGHWYGIRPSPLLVCEYLRLTA